MEGHHMALTNNERQKRWREKRNALAALEQTRRNLAAANARIEELKAVRTQLLLDEDDRGLDAADAEITETRKRSERHVEHIALLEARVREDERRAAAAKREATICAVEAQLVERDRVGADLQAAVAKAEVLFRRVIGLTEAAGAAWPFDMSQRVSCNLSPVAIQRLLSHELFRVGHRAFLGGRPGEVVPPAFPGGKSPDHRLLGMPERVPALVDVLKDSSRFASQVMRGQFDLPPIEPEPAAAVAEIPPPGLGPIMTGGVANG
jgi:hypothetical protein